MAQIRSTTGGNYSKYNAALEPMIKDSMENGTSIIHSNKKYVLKNNKRNHEALKEYLEKSLKGGKYPLNEIFLETMEGTLINFGSLEKPRFRKIANKGDVAEGIFSAAIYARFLNKNEKIDNEKVKNVLKKAKKTKRNVPGKRTIELNLNEKSLNSNGVTYDGVHIQIILAKSNMESLLDETLWDKELKEIFDSSVSYANSEKVKKWANLLYENNQENLIEVISAGTEDQTETKVDIYVKIDNKNVDINVSLKVGDVKQFGQIGGLDFSKQVELWKKLNIEIKDLNEKYHKLLAEKKIFEALSLIFERASNKENIKSDKFVEFIKYYATLNEKGVTLVSLGRKTKIYDFDSLKKENIKNISSYVKKDSMSKPTIIFEANSLELLQIRIKVENQPSSEFGYYVRTYIEKMPGLSYLISKEV